MRVNGDEIKIDGQITIKALLKREGYPVDRVAVEKNGVIVPKTAFETECAADSDVLEIVAFTGGG